MKMNDFINKWYGKRIDDWGSETSPEYKQFEKEYKNILREIGKEIDFELYSFSNNHYDFSAVMKSNKTNSFYYVSISDVRAWNTEWADSVLYRTMKHDKDWTGGQNCYSKLQELGNNLNLLDRQKTNSVFFEEDMEL